mgnify:CR=1 FL=1
MSFIIYEDDALVVLDKPAGYSSEEGVPLRLREQWGKPDAYVGVIHRLDTGVSGLMVYAKTPQAAAALSRQVTRSQEAYAVQDGRAEPAADARLGNADHGFGDVQGVCQNAAAMEHDLR